MFFAAPYVSFYNFLYPFSSAQHFLSWELIFFSICIPCAHVLGQKLAERNVSGDQCRPCAALAATLGKEHHSVVPSIRTHSIRLSYLPVSTSSRPLLGCPSQWRDFIHITTLLI